MLKTDRICAIIFIVALAMLIPSVRWLKFSDEMIAVALGVLALIDCCVNNSWRRYSLLWIIVGIMTFYALYSLLFLDFNTPGAIATDWIIELKPFVPFIVFLVVRPAFSPAQMKIIRIIALANVALAVIFMLMPGNILKTTLGHISMGGTIILASTVAYILASRQKSEHPLNKVLVAAMLCSGLLCTRAKYFGIFVCAIFLLYFYRPGMFHNMNWKKATVAVALPALIIIVAWHKIDYYFLSGNSDTVNMEVLESFARPVLYATAALIFADYLPFGSGLASFATYASQAPYSDLYYEYGINAVFGLSPSYPAFICDAFYPSLAQFGIVGLGLFAWLWIYIASMLRRLIRSNPEKFRLDYVCGWILILFILIESIAGTTFVQTPGMCAMMMLGIVCAKAPAAVTAKDTSTVNTPVLNGI